MKRIIEITTLIVLMLSSGYVLAGITTKNWTSSNKEQTIEVPKGGVVGIYVDNSPGNAGIEIKNCKSLSSPHIPIVTSAPDSNILCMEPENEPITFHSDSEKKSAAGTYFVKTFTSK